MAQRWHAKGACVTPNKKERKSVKYYVRQHNRQLYISTLLKEALWPVVYTTVCTSMLPK